MLSVPPAPMEMLPVTLPVVSPAPSCRVPVETVVSPAYVLFLLRIAVPAPVFVRFDRAVPAQDDVDRAGLDIVVGGAGQGACAGDGAADHLQRR